MLRYIEKVKLNVLTSDPKTLRVKISRKWYKKEELIYKCYL